MAKKKKKSSGRVTKKPTKKKAAKKKVAKKKAAKKKAVRKKSSPKKASKKAPQKATKSRSSSSSGAKSVDGVLKKYDKERSALGSQQATLSKKIEDLQAKTRVFEEQIAELQKQESATQVAITELDSHRDEEVGALLSKLGVQLGGGSPVSAANTPTIDEEEPPEADADDDDANGDDSAEADDEAADEVEEEDAESADESEDET